MNTFTRPRINEYLCEGVGHGEGADGVHIGGDDGDPGVRQPGVLEHDLTR